MHGFIGWLGAIGLSACTGTVFAWGPLAPMPGTLQPWPGGATLAAGFYVQQQQWPGGYGIRVYAPGRRTADVQVGVAGRTLLIRSQGGQRQAPLGRGGPVFMQYGGFSQVLALPADADLQRMQISSRDGVIEIFVPQRHR
ncbi:MAG: Hsp20/alpha crystallin family [Pseudomonadota bacterium]|jgi:HSP20 family molecular chaperone IbpA